MVLAREWRRVRDGLYLLRHAPPPFVWGTIALLVWSGWQIMPGDVMRPANYTSATTWGVSITLLIWLLAVYLLVKYMTDTPIHVRGGYSLESQGLKVLRVRVLNGAPATPVDKIRVQIFDINPKPDGFAPTDLLGDERFFLGPGENRDVPVLEVRESSYQIIRSGQTIPKADGLTLDIAVYSTSHRRIERFRVTDSGLRKGS